MNPTAELVGTVVSEPEEVARRRFFGLHLEIETCVTYVDSFDDRSERWDQHEVTVAGELARRRSGIRCGDRIHVRGELAFEMRWE